MTIIIAGKTIQNKQIAFLTRKGIFLLNLLNFVHEKQFCNISVMSLSLYYYVMKNIPCFLMIFPIEKGSL